MLIFVMMTNTLEGLSAELANCELGIATLHWYNFIPIDLPEEVTDVKIADLNPGIAIRGPLFAGKRWANISSLEIRSNTI